MKRSNGLAVLGMATIAVALLVAACGGDSDPTPVPLRPTATPTP